MSVRSPAAVELVDSREILPGQWLQAFHAPRVAASARAGHYVHLREIGPGTPARRPAPISTVDPASGTVAVQFRWTRFGTERLAALRPGDGVELHGPLGRPFELDPRTRHLLLVAGGSGISALRLLADQGVREGRQVTLLFGAGTARDVYPTTLLPDEVEYVVATDDGSMGQRGPVTALVPEYEAWADQAFASGPVPMLAEVARLATGRRERLGVAQLGRKRGGGRPAPPGSPAARRKAYLQVVLEQSVACAAGTCLACVAIGSGGVPQRVCREGPVFAAEELAWGREA